MLTTGVDLVDIKRIERVLSRFGEKFLARVYTPDEIRYSRGRPAELAARFAAKEAAAKALGVGMRILSPAGVAWRDVETLNEMSGKPYLILHGHARALAEAQGLTEWAISLSHDRDIAIAFVVAM
jgi:holo-[acyl-carrier protein] synthase